MVRSSRVAIGDGRQILRVKKLSTVCEWRAQGETEGARAADERAAKDEAASEAEGTHTGEVC